MRLIAFLSFLIALIGCNVSGTYTDPQTWMNRTVMVHLFEWKYEDIAKECEFLAKYNYGAIQLSPVQV